MSDSKPVQRLEVVTLEDHKRVTADAKRIIDRLINALNSAGLHLHDKDPASASSIIVGALNNCPYSSVEAIVQEPSCGAPHA